MKPKAKRRLWGATLPWMLSSMEALRMVLVELLRLHSSALNEKEQAFAERKLDEYRKWIKVMREFSRRFPR